jgi:ribonuclease P protein component
VNAGDRRYNFFRAMRLNSPARFKQLYADGNAVARGPIKLFAMPNELKHPRLGISIGRRVGTAPRRNRIKRLLREAFRLMQHDWPSGYDLVIVVRPHEPLLLADYQRALSGAMVKLVRSGDGLTNRRRSEG